MGKETLMGKILFAFLLLKALAFTDSNVHARIVPFLLANDIIGHSRLL